jgi:hypothetical protein
VAADGLIHLRPIGVKLQAITSGRHERHPESSLHELPFWPSNQQKLPYRATGVLLEHPQGPPLGADPPCCGGDACVCGRVVRTRLLCILHVAQPDMYGHRASAQSLQPSQHRWCVLSDVGGLLLCNRCGNTGSQAGPAFVKWLHLGISAGIFKRRWWTETHKI